MFFTSALQNLHRAGLIVVMAAAATGAAQTAPADETAGVLLTVESGGQKRMFDLAALDALPQHSFRTTTLWTQGAVTFRGPALRDVLAAAGAGATVTFEAQALNGYSVTFAREAIEDRVPIIATRRDGKPFGPRDLGPLWVVYPYDAEVRFRSETVYAQSIWQLTRIAARPSGD